MPLTSAVDCLHLTSCAARGSRQECIWSEAGRCFDDFQKPSPSSVPISNLTSSESSFGTTYLDYATLFAIYYNVTVLLVEVVDFHTVRGKNLQFLENFFLEISGSLQKNILNVYKESNCVFTCTQHLSIPLHYSLQWIFLNHISEACCCMT